MGPMETSITHSWKHVGRKGLLKEVLRCCPWDFRVIHQLLISWGILGYGWSLMNQHILVKYLLSATMLNTYTYSLDQSV